MGKAFDRRSSLQCMRSWNRFRERGRLESQQADEPTAQARTEGPLIAQRPRALVARSVA